MTLQASIAYELLFLKTKGLLGYPEDLISEQDLPGKVLLLKIW